MEKFRITKVAPHVWELRHPDGYWVGPGLGEFASPADAMEWFTKVYLPRAGWTLRGNK